jgi:large subunit ribosomal protein L34e
MDSRGFANAKKREKTVSRAYGGSRCHACVRQRYAVSTHLSSDRGYSVVKWFFCPSCSLPVVARVIRAFLIEEQKIVKKVLADMSRKSKKSE